MNTTNKISVIIPVFNSEKYIKQCIDNLFAQTYKNLEIIIVDDGSTDNTKQIAQEFDVIYKFQQNKGVYSARNLGLDFATGEYIHFLDVDDLINIDFYKNLIDSAIQTDSDIACCSFFFERFRGQSQLFDDKYIVSNINDKIALTNVHIYGACWRYLIKKSLLADNKIRFDNGRASFDRVFSLKTVYFANKIITVPKSIYVYKNRTKSITTTKSFTEIKKRHADRKAANSLIQEFAFQHNFSTKKRYVQSWNYKILGITLFSKYEINCGNIKWKILGMTFFQKKETGI